MILDRIRVRKHKRQILNLAPSFYQENHSKNLNAALATLEKFQAPAQQKSMQIYHKVEHPPSTSTGESGLAMPSTYLRTE